MSAGEEKVILYRLGRAREAVDEAKVLFDAGHVNAHVNRLYYACYYAVSALLLSRGIATTRHTRTRALFHQLFVKPGTLSTAMGQHLDRLFDSRQKGDYADFTYFRAEEVADWLDETCSFIEQVEALLGRDKPGK